MGQVVSHNKVSVGCVFLGRGNTIEAKNNGEDRCSTLIIKVKTLKGITEKLFYAHL